MQTFLHVPAGEPAETKQVQQITLTTLQFYVGGYVELVRIAPGIDLYVNEEAILRQMPPNRVFSTHWGQNVPILGDAVLVASNDEGETVGLTPEQAAEWLEKMKNTPRARMTEPKPSYFFDRFFAEKDIPYKVFDVTDSQGVPHVIPQEVVIEAIKGTRGSEKAKIESTLRMIDYKNGDVNHYLEHLARGLAENYSGALR